MQAYKILPFYRHLCARIGIESEVADSIGSSADTVVPHPLLRRALQNDSAMDAVLAGGGINYALGSFDNAPFALKASGLIQLSSALIFDPAALSAAARWGLEAHHVRRSSGTGMRQLVRLERYGKAVIEGIPESSRQRLLAVIPQSLRAGFLGVPCADPPGDELLSWIAGLAAIDAPREELAPGYGDTELDYPMERILARGGDSRLAIDSRTGCNRYGVPPRPRPEAVHFSSSTASAITDYGFLFCDLLRRDLLASLSAGKASEQDLRSRMVTAIGQEILALFGLDETVCDVAITPSGTDAELLAVAVARSGAAGTPLVNVLIAPDESGSGVRLAASGRWFNDIDTTAVQAARGTAAWPDADVRVREIPIRDGLGNALATDVIDGTFLEVCQAALAEGNHLLVHVLMSSKTDLYAPGFDVVADLVARAHDHVDVVVDACQLRADFSTLGDLVRQGWMVQVSGSKFLTGPPFSGALMLPAPLRSRAKAIVEELMRSSGIAGLADWLTDWTSLLPSSVGGKSYGPLFRWLPALIEAKLFLQLPEDFRLEVASRFRDALLEQMANSRYLNIVEQPATDVSNVITQHSILSFVVLGKRPEGELTPLTEAECKHLFNLLNQDVASLLHTDDFREEALARQPVHIGQPVTLGSSDTAITVLRLVLGARFFTIVGHSDPESRVAALESEIADARRAIAKVELLASCWWRVGCIHSA